MDEPAHFNFGIVQCRLHDMDNAHLFCFASITTRGMLDTAETLGRPQFHHRIGLLAKFQTSVIFEPIKRCFCMEKLKGPLAIAWAWLGLASAFSVFGADKISYNRDIRPILSDNCFHCHGPDLKARKGKFRLDVREDAVAKGAIVPGKPKESELVARIFTLNQDDMMPPLEAHKSLTSAQKGYAAPLDCQRGRV